MTTSTNTKGNPHHDELGRFARAEMNYDSAKMSYTVFRDYAEEFYDAMDKNQQEAMNEYADQAYEELNHSLRTDKELGDFDNIMVNNLESAMKPLPWDTVVYRAAVTFPTTPVGESLLDKGFVSTSAYSRKAWTFAGTNYLRIFLPKGTPAIVYNQKIEQEVLLPRNSKFKVLSRSKTKGAAHVYTNIDLMYVPQEGK